MDKTEAMILQVEKNRVLYDKSEKDYKDIKKKKRETIWHAIGLRVGLTGIFLTCVKKVMELLTQYDCKTDDLV